MKFCDLVQFMHHNYEKTVNAGEFVKILTDAILDDEALEKASPNPIYGLKKSTLEAYYSGRLPISQKKASALTPRLDEAKFADFVNTYSFDALNHMKDKLVEFGFEVEPSEVGQACTNILAQIMRRRAEGLSDDVTVLNYQRMEIGRKLKNIAPATIERRGDKLHISGEVITIHQALVPDDIGKHELDYIRALYEAYAQKLKKDTFTADDVPSLPKRYAENYKEQRMAYYSVVSIERSVRDIFDDGEDEFGKLKDDAWHGINTTYWKDYDDGYARLNAVLDKITSTTLDSSVLSQMRNLIRNLEKKGICHILVNDGVTMIVASNDKDGEISLHRDVGKNQVEVVSTIEGIDSGTYDVNYSKGAKNPPLNEVWLKLIGIEQETMIVTNARFEKKRLTWCNLLRGFYLDENRIDDSDSIVEPKHRYMESTLFLSALLYLITGRSFSETDAQEEKKIKKVRRKTVTDYVNRKIQDAAGRKEQLEKDLHIFDGADVEEQIAQATAALQETQRKIDRALAESQKILSSILDAEERAAESDVLLTRYHRLAAQYKADIQRLSLIAEGEEAYQEVPQSTKCPYCEGTITPRKRISYIAYSKVEMERTMAHLSELEETEKDVEDRKKEIRAELEELKQQRDALESKIKTELRPQENEQQNTVNAYKSYLRIASEIALIETYATDFGNDLTALENEQKNDKKLEYHPKDYFGDDFATTMSEFANSILKECCYSGLVQAHFNFNTFDIEINGEDKGTSHGKGYHSYLSTVMIMMLRKYLAANAKFDPHVFIVDTPLHGFDDGVDDKTPDSMRAGLYRYFMNHQDEGQLIIIENLDHIPSLDY